MAKKKVTTPAGAERPACPEGLSLPRQTREEYVENVLQQIGDFEDRLETLEADMESSGWDDIANFRGQLDDLRVKLRDLRSRSEELEAVADRAWPDAREEIEDALAGVGGGVEDLAAVLSPVLPE
jgi:phage shock protein A